jgi:RNA polymerase II subunit A small phosphatase-like protein
MNLLPDFPVDHILSREHCRIVNGVVVKDLMIFDCDLKDIIIVDNCRSCFSLQPRNGIFVSGWMGGMRDSRLITVVMPLLVKCCGCNDVREVIGTKPLRWTR